MAQNQPPPVERRHGVDLVHYFWVPYAVVIVLMIIGLGWSGNQEERIRANAAAARAASASFANVQNQITTELLDECAYDTKIQEAIIETAATGTAKKGLIGSPPFCHALPKVTAAPTATP